MRFLPLCLCLLLSPPALAQQGSPEDIIAQLKSLPPGTTVEIVTESVTGTGVGVTAQGEKIDSTLQTGAPSVKLPPASADGGGSESRIKVWGSTVNPAVIVLAFGGLACWAGAVLCILRKWGLPRAPLVLGGAGLAFFVAALWPAIVAYLAGLLALGGLVAYLFSERGSTRFREALRAVTAGVAAAPDDIQSAVKAEIGKHADDADKATIKRLKKADDLA